MEKNGDGKPKSQLLILPKIVGGLQNRMASNRGRLMLAPALFPLQ
jgi:hypothetical protein